MEESRQRIIQKLLNEKGSFHIEREFTCAFGANITIGGNFYANYNVQLRGSRKPVHCKGRCGPPSPRHARCSRAAQIAF